MSETIGYFSENFSAKGALEQHIPFCVQQHKMTPGVTGPNTSQREGKLSQRQTANVSLISLFWQVTRGASGLAKGAFLILRRDILWLMFPVYKFCSICDCQNWLRVGRMLWFSGPGVCLCQLPTGPSLHTSHKYIKYSSVIDGPEEVRRQNVWLSMTGAPNPTR